MSQITTQPPDPTDPNKVIDLNQPIPKGDDTTPTLEGPHNKPPEPTPDPSQQLHTVKINGEEKQLTMAQLMEYAQKAAGAEAKFQEAAQIRTKAEETQRVADLAKKASDPNLPDDQRTQAEREFLKAAHGYSDAELDAFYGQTDPDPTDPTDPAPTEPSQKPNTMSEQDFQQRYNQQRLGEIRDDVQSYIREAFDSEDGPSIIQRIESEVGRDHARRLVMEQATQIAEAAIAEDIQTSGRFRAYEAKQAAKQGVTKGLKLLTEDLKIATPTLGRGAETTIPGLKDIGSGQKPKVPDKPSYSNMPDYIRDHLRDAVEQAMEKPDAI
jgi:hypothetical protein